MSRAAKPRNAQFLYLAARPNGQRKVGVVRAESARQLSDHFRRQRLVPLRTWELPAWAGAEAKVKLKDQAELHTQLAQLLTRGVPLVEALEVTATAVSPRTKGKVERMREMVSAGSGFADAAAAVHAFDVVTLSVYRAAERTGDLGGAAKQLSVTTRRQLAITGKVGTLLMYPLIVLSISMLMGIGILTQIVPRIGTALESAGVALPWYTRALLDLGTFMRDNAIWCLLAAALLAGGVLVARQTIFGVLASIVRRLPLFRDVIMTQESARFFTVMAAMTRSGITLADALGVAINALSHPVLKAQLGTLRTRLIEGGVLRQLIDTVTALPVPTRRLLIAAERSGDLESAFGTLADDLTEELDRRTARLMAALEPGLIVVMFLVVGTMILAIMIPLIKSSAQGMG